MLILLRRKRMTSTNTWGFYSWQEEKNCPTVLADLNRTALEKGAVCLDNQPARQDNRADTPLHQTTGANRKNQSQKDATKGVQGRRNALSSGGRVFAAKVFGLSVRPTEIHILCIITYV